MISSQNNSTLPICYNHVSQIICLYENISLTKLYLLFWSSQNLKMTITNFKLDLFLFQKKTSIQKLKTYFFQFFNSKKEDFFSRHTLCNPIWSVCTPNTPNTAASRIFSNMIPKKDDREFQIKSIKSLAHQWIIRTLIFCICFRNTFKTKTCFIYSYILWSNCSHIQFLLFYSQRLSKP